MSQEYNECYCEILQRDKSQQCISRKDSWPLKIYFYNIFKLFFSLSHSLRKPPPSTFFFSIFCRSCCCFLSISTKSLMYVFYFNCLIFSIAMIPHQVKHDLVSILMMMMSKQVNKVNTALDIIA